MEGAAVRGLVLALATALVAACDGEATGDRDDCRGSASRWDLWARGPCLRGAAIYQRRVYPEFDGDALGPGAVGPPFVPADFDRLAGLGANLVVVSHPGTFREEPPFERDEAIADNLDALVEMAAAADLFVVVATRTGPGRNEFVFLDEEDPDWLGQSLDDNSIWSDAAAQEAWAAMWRELAIRYRSNPAVVGYEIMVEPNGNDALGARRPGDFYPDRAGTLFDWNPLFRRVTDAIREVDPETPVVVDSMNWGDIAWLPSIVPGSDERTVYAVHQYRPAVYTTQTPPLDLAYPGFFDADGDGLDEAVDADWLYRLLLGAAEFSDLVGAPVAATEMGVMRWEPGAAAFLTDEAAALEDLGMNRAVWSWAPSWEPWATHDAFDILHGPDPSSHEDATGNALLEAVLADWSLNSVRPSSAAF